MTANEQAASTQQDEYFAVDENARPAWRARRGVRVIRLPSGADACPRAFPVMATDYGAYYLPSDELYSGMGSFWAELCFASEQNAIDAGYRRGPH